MIENQIKILLIEDEPDDVYLFQSVLQQTDMAAFTMTHAYSLSVAIQLLRTNHFDIILLDLTLPDSVGLDTLKQLQTYTHNSPVIILTGLADKTVAMEALQLGAQDYLNKEKLESDLLGRAMLYAIERNRIEQQLRDLNASKDKFFSIISHDLRSPFASMMMFFDLLAKDFDKFSLAEIHEHVKTLQLSVKNVYALLEHLLQWASLHIGRLKYEPRQICFNHLVNETFLFVSNLAQQKEIQLVNLTSPEINIYADSNMLETVIRNLVGNGIKFTPLGGKIWVEAVVEGDIVQISVRDNGVGIEPHNLPHLFRIDNHHTTLGTAYEKGTGLGLVLCKEFIEKHGGKIWVESQLGQGTTFFFTIPRVEIT